MLRERAYVVRSCKDACSACYDSVPVLRFEGKTPLTSAQGGVHQQGAQSPCADTPPRLALSDSLVLNAGYQNGKLPAAHWIVCLHSDPSWSQGRDLPGCRDLKFRGLTCTDRTVDNYEGNVSQVFSFCFLRIFSSGPLPRPPGFGGA